MSFKSLNLLMGFLVIAGKFVVGDALIHFGDGQALVETSEMTVGCALELLQSVMEDVNAIRCGILRVEKIFVMTEMVAYGQESGGCGAREGIILTVE